MPIFNIKFNKLTPINEIMFKLEKDLQKLNEENLETIFRFEFVRTEFRLHNLRIDTLAFDTDTQSFVIIEYKREKSFSVVDQGYAYLALMLNNKADFILEYNEKSEKNLRKKDVDWSQSRVLFLADNFTTHQRNAINFSDMPIELWEVKRYDNGTVLYNQLKPVEAAESITTVTKNETVIRVADEVKKYSIENHFKEGWEKTRAIFEQLSRRILDIDSRIGEYAVKHYIGYKLENSVLCQITTRKSKLRVDLTKIKPEELKDPEDYAQYQKNSYKFYHQHITEFFIRDEKDLDYALYLIRQVYDKKFVKR